MIDQAAGIASTSFTRANSQVVIYVILQDTSGYIRKIKWDENGWSRDTEPPLFKAKNGAPITATSWYADSSDHVRIYYFDDSNTFSEYRMDGSNWQKGSSLPQ